MKLLFTCILCTLLTAVRSQPHEGRPAQFSFKAGASYNLMNFNAGGNTGTATFLNKWKPGFYLGGALTVPVDETFSFRPEYLYRYMGGREEGRKLDYTVHYLSLPVLLKAALSRKVALVAGPEFGLMIHTSQSSAGASYNVTHDTEERAIWAVGGVEWRVAGSLFVEGRYLHGLNHIGLGQRSDIREFKWRGAEVGIGWGW